MKQSCRHQKPESNLRAAAFAAVVLTVLTMSPAGLAAGRWLKMSDGLDGGRVRHLAINPLDPMILYAGTEGGSLFQTRDGGVNWHAVREGLPDGQSIAEIVIAPSDPRRLYVRVSNSGFFRSNDEGAHWEGIGQGLPQNSETPALPLSDRGGVFPAGESVFIGTPGVDLFDADRLYIPTGQGLYRSLDAGATWTPSNDGLTNLNVRSVLVSSLVLFAATNSGVFRSINGADSWQPLAGAGLPAATLNNLIRSGGILYVVAFDQGVYRSSDLGVTWEAASNGLPGGENPERLVADPGDPQVLYALYANSGVFRTSNGADDWAPLDTVDPIVDDIRDLAVHPSDSSLYAGHGERGVFRSLDAGMTWAPARSGLTAVEISALYVQEEMPDTVYAGSLNNGGYKSTDGGHSWDLLDDLYPFTVDAFRIHPDVPSTIYAVANGSVYLSADGGGTWVQPPNNGLPNGVRALLIHPDDPDTLFAGVFFGGVYRSDDGGINWAAINTGLAVSSVISLAMRPDNPSTLYAGTLGGIFRTQNAGVSWEAINSGLKSLNIRPIVVHPEIPTTVYVGTFGGGAFRSLNGGNTWEAINNGLGDNVVLALAIDPSAPTTLYAGTSDAGLYRSTDGGDSWEAASAGLFNPGIRSILINPANPSVLYLGTARDGIYKCSPQQLYFPILMGDASSFTGVALANDPDGATQFEIEARNGDGLLQPYPDNPHQEVLAPGQQVARLGRDFFGVDGNEGRDGWMQLRTDGARLASFFQFGTVTAAGLTRLDGSVAIADLSTTLYFTRIYDGPGTFPLDSGAADAVTMLVIANPTEDKQSLTFRIYDSEGVGHGVVAERVLGPQGCLQVRVVELFEVAKVRGGFIEVTASRGGVVGFEYVQLEDTLLGFNAWTQPSRKLFSAQLAHGTAGAAVVTSLKVINSASVPTAYTLEAFDAAGDRFYEETLGLDPHDSSEFALGELLGLGDVGAPATTGSIRITAEEDILLGDVMFGDPFTARFAAALPLQSTALTEAIFSQVANVDDGPVSTRTFTGLALFNPNDGEAAIRVTVYTQDSLPSGSTDILLGGFERLSETVTGLIPETTGQIGGYITLRSNRPIVAQVLFGNGTLDFLSAVPPS